MGNGKCCRRITERFSAASTFFIKQLVMADEVWFKGLKGVGTTPWKLSGSRNGKGGFSSNRVVQKNMEARVFVESVSLRIVVIQNSSRRVNSWRMPTPGFELGEKDSLEKRQPRILGWELQVPDWPREAGVEEWIGV